mmetsp:Transcript_14489/g.31484  ORF Transcript_14489/g.31484 Transcript_14489/m.31484 type:complete len:226 (+) Transcript_14489:435-1112(+)
MLLTLCIPAQASASPGVQDPVHLLVCKTRCTSWWVVRPSILFIALLISSRALRLISSRAVRPQQPVQCKGHCPYTTSSWGHVQVCKTQVVSHCGHRGAHGALPLHHLLLGRLRRRSFPICLHPHAHTHPLSLLMRRRLVPQQRPPPVARGVGADAELALAGRAAGCVVHHLHCCPVLDALLPALLADHDAGHLDLVLAAAAEGEHGDGHDAVVALGGLPLVEEQL